MEMDFDDWLAAPHPPHELLLSIACGSPGKLEDLDPFAAASPEGAAWVAFLNSTTERYEILGTLPEYYNARAVSERMEKKWLAANENVLKATADFHLLTGAKAAGRVTVPEGDAYDAVREDVSRSVRNLEDGIKEAADRIETGKREEARLREIWVDSIKRVGAAETYIEERT